MNRGKKEEKTGEVEEKGKETRRGVEEGRQCEKIIGETNSSKLASKQARRRRRERKKYAGRDPPET